jgi:hypothetical protein
MRIATRLTFTGSFLTAVNILFLNLVTTGVYRVSDGVLIASLGLVAIGVMLASAALIVWLVEYAKSR